MKLFEAIKIFLFGDTINKPSEQLQPEAIPFSSQPTANDIISSQHNITKPALLNENNNELLIEPENTIPIVENSIIPTRQEFAKEDDLSINNCQTIGEMQNITLSALGNEDVISGLEFFATLQLRTPLRVLKRHGEIHRERNTVPPRIVKNQWEGIWIPKLKSLGEILGNNIDDIPPGKQSSEIGPVISSDYLRFLISIREIVEINDSIQIRVDKLRGMLQSCDCQDFVQRHGGVESIVQYFFPREIRPMPALPIYAKNELTRLGLNSPDILAAASDDILLGIKGIGKAKLRAIREHCADMAKPRDSDRKDTVSR